MLALPFKVKTMIDATIKLTVPPEKRKEILQTITAILGPIRLEGGCLGCNCYVDVESENRIFLKEEWQTRASLDAHLRSVHFGVLLGAMSLLAQEPEIRFDTIAATAGVDDLIKPPK
ncbi:MAG: putative quinol monooxygenase [Trichloromonas sp.]|jgi:quinol monooxygenase YgiN|nr:putative quinol monooxygenase [Trichloromonas sp.]